jgi:UDP-2-acetamido-3-amino-2,3-dideoxy-glucuronate N-acetyltransferase
VAIATPSATHFELARAALEAGKDVFVEKPLCLDPANARELLVVAEARHLTLMVGHLLQYHPSVVRLRELVATGVLGKVLTITSSRLNLGKVRRDESALWSFAPHDVSLILSLMGDQLPESVLCVGGSYLRGKVADTTLTVMRFADDVLAQIHVSWLNPFKEQRLTVVGSEGMAVFDDTRPWPEKLMLYRKYMSWSSRQEPVPTHPRAEPELVPEQEPLLLECQHFLNCCAERKQPRTDGHEAWRVLRVLELAQRSMQGGGERLAPAVLDETVLGYFAHPSAVVEPGALIGEGSRIWHFSHVMSGARIGQRCSLGQNVNVAGGAVIGHDVKVQNNVSIYAGVELENGVFLGPSCVLTNVKNPRAELDRRTAYERTLIRHGATVGANATIVCGVTLGRYCFIGAGAVVTRSVPDYALMQGNPARRVGWMSRHGQRLTPDSAGELRCPESGLRYREVAPHVLRCLDAPDENLGAERCSSST